MSIERIKLSGLQSRSLELGGKKPWQEKVTPTKDSDIGERAKAYKRLVTTAVIHTMALEGSSDSPDQQEIHSAALMTVRDEVKHFGFVPDLFAEVVSTKVRSIKELAKQEEEDARVADEVARVIANRKGELNGDWKLINQEFPGQFEDWEKQAFMGDVPPRNDAGGFEMKRRGW